jgi:cobalamin synthase
MFALIFIPVITRCCSAVAVLAGKPLAHSQYVEEPGVKNPTAEITAVFLMGLSALFAALAIETGIPAIKVTYSVWLAIAGALAAYLAALFGAVRQLKGVSGDLAGYSLTIGEAFALVMLALLA